MQATGVKRGPSLSTERPLLLLLMLWDQRVPGSFAHAVHHLVDVLDLLSG